LTTRAGDWLSRAGRKSRAARRSHDGGHYEWACFAAHQAAETSIKAALLALGGEAIFLFGSFAHGTPTPRSDANLLVAIGEGADRRQIFDCCLGVFLTVAVPVALFVQTWAAIEAS